MPLHEAITQGLKLNRDVLFGQGTKQKALSLSEVKGNGNFENQLPYDTLRAGPYSQKGNISMGFKSGHQLLNFLTTLFPGKLFVLLC